MARVPERNKKVLVTFVQNQVARLLVRGGFTSDQAEQLTAQASDSEILALFPEPQTLGAIGDGKWLQWLADNMDKIVEVVNTIASLFLLMKGQNVVNPNPPEA